MRLKLTCKDTVRLVLEGEDRTLPLGERVLIRVHLGYCRGCTRFSKQVHLMRGAMNGWRALCRRQRRAFAHQPTRALTHHARRWRMQRQIGQRDIRHCPSPPQLRPAQVRTRSASAAAPCA